MGKTVKRIPEKITPEDLSNLLLARQGLSTAQAVLAKAEGAHEFISGALNVRYNLNEGDQISLDDGRIVRSNGDGVKKE